MEQKIRKLEKEILALCDNLFDGLDCIQEDDVIYKLPNGECLYAYKCYHKEKINQYAWGCNYEIKDKR